MDSSSLRWSGGTPLDPGVLTRLRHDLGDDVARRFLCTYVRLLPERLDGIQAALTRREPLKAARIACDLRTASSMLGAVRLAHLTHLLERHLRKGEIDRAVGGLSIIRREALEVSLALQRAVGSGGDHWPSR